MTVFIFLIRSKNSSSNIHIPQWLMVAGVGLLLTAGLGSLIVLLLKVGKSSLRIRDL